MPYTSPAGDDLHDNLHRTQHHGRSAIPGTGAENSGDAQPGRTLVFEPGEVDDIADLLTRATAHVETPR